MSSGTLKVTTPSDREIAMTRVFDAPRNLVFEANTKPELLKRWLGMQNGWSLAFAQGFVDGETSRRLGKAPALHALVGIDEYSMGFRAGYFERQHHDSSRKPDLPARRPGQVRAG